MKGFYRKEIKYIIQFPGEDALYDRFTSNSIYFELLYYDNPFTFFGAIRKIYRIFRYFLFKADCYNFVFVTYINGVPIVYGITEFELTKHSIFPGSRKLSYEENLFMVFLKGNVLNKKKYTHNPGSNTKLNLVPLLNPEAQHCLSKKLTDLVKTIESKGSLTDYFTSMQFIKNQWIQKQSQIRSWK